MSEQQWEGDLYSGAAPLSPLTAQTDISLCAPPAAIFTAHHMMCNCTKSRASCCHHTLSEPRACLCLPTRYVPRGASTSCAQSSAFLPAARKAVPSHQLCAITCPPSPARKRVPSHQPHVKHCLPISCAQCSACLSAARKTVPPISCAQSSVFISCAPTHANF